MKLKTGDNNHIGQLTSLLYSNGFGGSAIVYSALEIDEYNMWGLQISSSSKFFVNEPSSFYIPRSLFGNNVTFNVKCPKEFHDRLK